MSQQQEQPQDSLSPAKRRKLSSPSSSHSLLSLLPPLESFPISLTDIESHVASLLTAAATNLTKSSADSARESTFEYLQGEDAALVALYTPVYAAAQLFYAQGCYHEATDLMLTLRSAEGEDISKLSPSQQQHHSKQTDSLRIQVIDCVDACLRAVDLAVLRTSVGVWTQIAKPLLQAAEKLRSSSTLATEEKEGELDDCSDRENSSSSSSPSSCFPPQFLSSSPGLCTDIPRVDASTMTVEAFLADYMTTTNPSPIILCNAISSWPALKKWTSLEYLKRKAAGRLVPVETYHEKDATQTYLTDTWEQRVMSFGDFVETYVVGAGSMRSESGNTTGSDGADHDGKSRERAGEEERGYLAQYQLFEQIPSLLQDIIVPRFCSALTREDLAAPPDSESSPPSAPLVSAWLGPKGTVSPLHNDPYHNLLAQVVGTKYLRLYSPADTAALYPREGPMCNNSYIDLDTLVKSETEAAKFPDFLMTPFHHCVLQPGEVLYIPRHYWHYVRSLEMSFSTSFWWGAKMALQRVPCPDDKGGDNEEVFTACY